MKNELGFATELFSTFRQKLAKIVVNNYKTK